MEDLRAVNALFLALTWQNWLSKIFAAMTEEAYMPRVSDPISCCVDYLQEKIAENKKVTVLKEIQGIIWKEGYVSGALKVCKWRQN